MSVYLDHAATTPLRPEVLDVMQPYLTEHFGNPSSIHGTGRRARLGLDEARETVARILGAKPREVVFTSGGTEADNLAVKGAAWAASADGRRVVTSSVEHKAVMHSCAVLERFGFEVTYLPVDRYGRLDPADVASAIRDHTTVVSVMYANNEVGTVQPIREIGAICRQRKVLFHVDAVQAAGFLPLDVDTLQVDLLSLGAHKIYGPKGVGALFVRQGTPLLTQLSGGSQERQRRAGTENVAGIVGFARALELAQDDLVAREAENARLARLRDGLIVGLTALPGVTLTGHATERLPNNASFLVDGVEGGDLVAALDLEGIAASTGSACTTGSADPSHVLLAMGIEPDQAHGSLRLTRGTDHDRGRRATDHRGDGLRARAAACRDGGARRGRIGLMGRTVAAMSGGVDSSVAAALLAREARTDEVIGVWMRLHPDGGEGYEQSRSCCSPDAADDARRVAQIAGIPFFILNLEREFGARVIDAFADGYLDGATPNPCQACNQYIKFDELLRRGLAAYGADMVATGHYARVADRDGRRVLLRAADADKDQTYFLWVLDQEQLRHTRFPLGELTKPQVRQIATELGLPTAAKPESQEICFVPAGDYRELLAERRGYAGEPGPIVDADGTAVGTHTGYAHYTVGQRHGLGLALGEAVYVREVRPASNTVVIGRREEVAASTFTVDGRRFVAGEPPAERFRASVRIRHRAPDVPAEITLLGDDRFAVETATPVWAPAPGQAAVLYDGDVCLGGGRIARAA